MKQGLCHIHAAPAARGVFRGVAEVQDAAFALAQATRVEDGAQSSSKLRMPSVTARGKSRANRPRAPMPRCLLRAGQMLESI